MTKELNFIDLFSGAGGFSCGLEMAGFRCLLGVDFDRHAMNTFALNHPHAQTYCGDVGELDNNQIDKILNGTQIDLVVGGPPCQGFSTVGPGNPMDLRNKLFREFIRIVSHTNPNYVIMENVTGLLAKKNEKTLHAILREFQNLGYNINVQVLEASDYGVPEKRRRTIFIGSKINHEITFPLATHGTKRPLNTVGKALDQLYRTKKLQNHDIEAALIKNKLEFKRIQYIPEGFGIRYQKDEINYLPKKLYLGVNWKTIPEGRLRQTKYFRLNRKGPSPTIMTHRHTYYHPVENRFLTQREAATLQSFPANFVFTGPVSSQWRQIGNAVPPLLGKVIGQHLHFLMKNADLLKTKKAKIKKHSLDKLRKSAFRYRSSAKNSSPSNLEL